MKFRSLLMVLFLGLGSPCFAQVAPPDGGRAERTYVKSFRGEDLSGKSFTKQDLSNCDFTDANLANTDFSDAILHNCSFNGAVVKATKFTNADLTGSDFREAELEYIGVFGAILNKVNFSGLDLSTVQLQDRKLRGADLRNVKGFWTIYGADFYEADLRGANFTKAQELNPATFRKAKYDQKTKWHANFDPKERGLVFVESKDEDAAVPAPIPPRP